MFTPFETTAGALLLHLATSTLLFDAGAILGASGLLRRVIHDPKHEVTQSPTIWFFGGMATAVGLTALSMPRMIPDYPVFKLDGLSILRTIGTGFLTGWGTKAGNKCGHLHCSPNSSNRIVADALLDICSAVLAGLVYGHFWQHLFSSPRRWRPSISRNHRWKLRHAPPLPYATDRCIQT
jgi:hypothetical protein